MQFASVMDNASVQRTGQDAIKGAAAEVSRNHLSINEPRFASISVRLKFTAKRIHIGKLAQHAFANFLPCHLAQLENERRDDVVLLGLCLRIEELPRLRKMISE